VKTPRHCERSVAISCYRTDKSKRDNHGVLLLGIAPWFYRPPRYDGFFNEITTAVHCFALHLYFRPPRYDGFLVIAAAI